MIELSACEKMIKLYIFVWNSLKGFSIKAITKCMKALYIHCIYNCYFSFYFGNLLWTGKCKPFWIIYVRVIDKIVFQFNCRQFSRPSICIHFTIISWTNVGIDVDDICYWFITRFVFNLQAVYEDAKTRVVRHIVQFMKGSFGHRFCSIKI